MVGQPLTYFTPFYKAYIGPPRSPEWEAKRTKKLKQVGFQCEKCGSRRRDWGSWLEVHHKTYARLGHEWLRDLQVLCNGPESNHCHDKATARMRRNRKIMNFIFG